MDARGRDDGEEEMLNMIYSGGEGGEDYSSQFLNDYGEGVELETRYEGPLTNSGEIY